MNKLSATLASLMFCTSAFAQAGPFTDRVLALTKDYTFFGPQYNGPWTTFGYAKGSDAKCMTITSWMDGSAVLLRVDMSPENTDDPPRLFIASPKFNFPTNKVDSSVSLTAAFFDSKGAAIAQGNFPNATIDSEKSIITKPISAAFINRMFEGAKMTLKINDLPPIDVKLDFARTAIQSLLRCIDDYDTLHKSK